ncbi:DUF6551 family protein [Methylobacterium sp. J-092]|uniref:DUF6551 family protein n=1 Tax=Methylobacterium sp. J-092 TaxID=2836667 RepID=UPI001FB8829C|nr:DUF6551 family protein [Methylobacterium sp. J-092]MCJ2007945.1 ParB N-terminal domain-containing protein [Methylobacterium sp. J-092]
MLDPDRGRASKRDQNRLVTSSPEINIADPLQDTIEGNIAAGRSRDIDRDRREFVRGQAMHTISTDGFTRPSHVDAGVAPMLQWLKISALTIDPSYQRPIIGVGRRNVERIASMFSWWCFTPVVVSPVEGGRFAIIDGQHRTTAALLVGYDEVPCQIVIAAREQQAAAFKAINCVTTPIARVAVHAAALVAGETWAVQVADVCARADATLLRYPLPISKQAAGQTMAVGAIKQCIKRHGQNTVITALQCVIETGNNKPGMLNARMIKALCAAIDRHQDWREGALALFDAFDQIDLARLQARCDDGSATGSDLVQRMAEVIAVELSALMPVTREHRPVRWDAPRPNLEVVNL